MAAFRIQPKAVQKIATASPSLRFELVYLWELFEEIALGLAPNGFAPVTITWEALRAWRGEMLMPPLKRWEVRALLMMSAQRASIFSEKSKTKT